MAGLWSSDGLGFSRNVRFSLPCGHSVVNKLLGGDFDCFWGLFVFVFFKFSSVSINFLLLEEDC